MRVQDLDLPLFGTILGGAIYMGPFWREKSISSDPKKRKKKTSKESSGFGGSRCKLGST
jgi:hypothetical protein